MEGMGRILPLGGIQKAVILAASEGEVSHGPVQGVEDNSGHIYMVTALCHLGDYHPLPTLLPLVYPKPREAAWGLSFWICSQDLGPTLLPQCRHDSDLLASIPSPYKTGYNTLGCMRITDECIMIEHSIHLPSSSLILIQCRIIFDPQYFCLDCGYSLWWLEAYTHKDTSD